MIKVGFIINYDPIKWLGGYNFVINLINSILLIKKRKIEPVLIVGKNFKFKNLNQVKFKVIKTDIFAKQSLFEKLLNKIEILITNKSTKYDEFFKTYNLHIISHHSFFLGNKSTVKSFTWIPDFQYLHFPKNFSLKNRILKTINIHLIANYSSKIILSSNDAKMDLKKISLKGYKKSSVSHFVFNVPKLSQISSLKYLKKKYKIKRKFFYLPNQYFVHKNHFTVLKALKELLKNKNNKHIVIVSTGYNVDHRDKEYFNKIKSYLSENCLFQNYKYLGVVSFKDMMSLMHHSIAVLNPSKFEGWSSSVEQAKSMGKKLILSDISVHREQKPLRSEFFKPDDYLKLAYLLKKIWNKHNPKHEMKIINKTYKNLNRRLVKFASNYQKIILNSK